MDLVEKYNIPAPRYTSYPTVPYWDNNLSEQKWIEHIHASFSVNNKNGISLYIHLPYCESLCTYCACNTRITVNHLVERPYINSLLKEWQLYLDQFGEKPLIKEIHLGGGTPTFFSPANLQYLVSNILSTATVSKDHDFSFEGHPGNTTSHHLQTLFDLGFKRVSFGIQDFDLKVQEAINRYQTFEEVKNIMEAARNIGYTSINADLVYGLPHQTSTSVNKTVEQIISLKPERIAFYSYAHVPWLKPGQRKYSEKDLPVAAEKRKLYESGKRLFEDAGYRDIGMDHFAFESDSLFKAFKNEKLHRNFMGYTAHRTELLIGLGCSSISDTGDAFSQNLKTVEEYNKVIAEGNFAVSKGHLLTAQDLEIKQHILNLMCKHQTQFTGSAETETVVQRLEEMITDGLAEIKNNTLLITEKGKSFTRNICLAFDERYLQNVPAQKLFSTTA